MILKAIEKNHYKWLNYVWAFKKNFFLRKKGVKETVTLQTLFSYIIKYCEKCSDEIDKNPEKKIKIICDWMLDFDDSDLGGSSLGSQQDDEASGDEAEEGKEEKKEDEERKEEPENILKALLFHMQDPLAIQYMGYYSQYLKQELFLFSLKQNNKFFIQKSLLMGAFEKQELRSAEVVQFILECFEDGSKTNFLL